MLPGQVVKRLEEKSRELGTRKVLVQLPDGLKPKCLEITKELENLGFDPVISGESNFGGCDLRFLDNAITLHVGHSEFLKDNRVVYWEYRVSVDPTDALEKALPKIAEKTICLVTTVQHLDYLDVARKLIEKCEKNVITKKGKGYPGQVLGCDAGAVGECDAVIFIGSGVFHAQFVALKTGKKVYAIDPYTREMQKVSGEKLANERYIRIEKGRDAKRIGVVVSSKPGQGNMGLGKTIVKKLRSKGKETAIILMDDITPYKLDNLNLDAYVIIACPRLVIDDWKNFRQPILLPDEALEL